MDPVPSDHDGDAPGGENPVGPDDVVLDRDALRADLDDPRAHIHIAVGEPDLVVVIELGARNDERALDAVIAGEVPRQKAVPGLTQQSVIASLIEVPEAVDIGRAQLDSLRDLWWLWPAGWCGHDYH